MPYTHRETYPLSVCCAEKRINCIFIFKHTSSAERARGARHEARFPERHEKQTQVHKCLRVWVWQCVGECLSPCVLAGVLLFSAMSLLLLWLLFQSSTATSATFIKQAAGGAKVAFVFPAAAAAVLVVVVIIVVFVGPGAQHLSAIRSAANDYEVCSIVKYAANARHHLMAAY